ncbi:MAG: glucosamine-6-phosphate deaminase [Lachnospiraceae bacterium]|nr:glucosamine-6-phosphate deaminase [Lachnospiraceae bacterium]
MRFIKTKDYEDMSRKAANIIGAQIILKPTSVLGLATGSTPVTTYANLVKGYQNGDLDFSRISSVNLDEYKGLTRDNEQSYYYFMNHHLFKHVNIDPAKTYLPDGTEPDANKACQDYEEAIFATGGVDLQLLGIGHNGHIGFNEPSDNFADKTFCVDLAESTIKANQRFFASYEDVPKQAYTMGIGTIMAASKILILASGKDKAAIIKEAFFGPVTPAVQASILQFHPNVTIVGDEAAFAECEEIF